MTPTLTAAARKAAARKAADAWFGPEFLSNGDQRAALAAIIARHYEAMNAEQRRELILLENIKRVAAHEWDASDQMDEIDRLIAARHCVSLDAERALQGEQATQVAQDSAMDAARLDWLEDNLDGIRDYVAGVYADADRAESIRAAIDAARHQAAQGETGKA